MPGSLKLPVQICMSVSFILSCTDAVGGVAFVAGTGTKRMVFTFPSGLNAVRKRSGIRSNLASQ